MPSYSNNNMKWKIVMDFDGTLSYGQRADGKKNTSIATLREGGYLSAEYEKAAHALHNYYHPIEIDPNISSEAKTQSMYEWWYQHNDLLISEGLNKDTIEKAGRSDYVIMRDGLRDFFASLHELQIEPYIFSAGRQELIYYTLSQNNISLDMSNIISNQFYYDDNGKAIDYTRPPITSANKNDTVIMDINNHNYDNIRDRYMAARNVIILGDSPSDANMIQTEYDKIIRIGFLNTEQTDTNYSERLQLYKQHFDYVLPHDATMHQVLNIVKKVKA